MTYALRPLTPADKPTVASLLTEAWGAAQVYALALDTMIDASDLPGWLAEEDGEALGLLTYLVGEDLLDIITINTYRPGSGVGSALLAQLDAPRIRVVALADNPHAIRFYERNGFHRTPTPHPRGIELIKTP